MTHRSSEKVINCGGNQFLSSQKKPKKEKVKGVGVCEKKGLDKNHVRVIEKEARERDYAASQDTFEVQLIFCWIKISNLDSKRRIPNLQLNLHRNYTKTAEQHKKLRNRPTQFFHTKPKGNSNY